MRSARRLLICAVVVAGVLAAGASPALAHATLVGSTPPAGGRVQQSSRAVELRFSEPVQILNRSDVTVVDGRGVRVDGGAPRTAPGDPARVVVPLSGPLVPSSYTVRYRVVSADSHAADAAVVFAVGGARLGEPILAGAGGLSETSPVAVGARVAELAGLGLLLGLLGFRLLVWGPVVAAGGLAAAERDRALRHGRRLFWRAFWALAVLAGVAETAVLAAKSAVVFHTGLAEAVLHPAAAYRLVASSRFGDLLGWRSAALVALVTVAFVAWTGERDGAPRPGVRRGALTAMALLGMAALTLLATQGHASQAPLAPLSVAADAVHLGAAAIWIGGLPCLVTVLLRAPRALPDGGRLLASATLRRFSRVALWSVVVVAVTGLARAAGELSAPAQLWTTGYGRDLVLKASLLLPILVLARRNRRFVAALPAGLTPSTARLRAVARSVQVELAIAMGIVTVAALLVAQIPGRA